MKIFPRSKKITILVLAGLLFSTALSLFWSPNKAFAVSAVASDYGLTVDGGDIKISQDDVRLRWINAQDIEVTFVNSTSPPLIARLDNLDERDDANKLLAYRIQGWDCDSNIRIRNPGGNGVAATQFDEVEFDVDFKVDSRGGCEDTDPGGPDFPIANPENSTAYFRQVDENTIERVDGGGQGPLTKLEDFPNTYIRDSEDTEDGCADRIIVDGSGNIKFFELDSKYGGDTPEDETGTNCDYNVNGAPPSNFTMVLSEAANASIPDGEGTSVGSIGTQGDSSPTCELGPNPLGWVVCPILNGILRGIDAIFVYFIDPFLRVSPVVVNDDNIVFEIWKGFRTFGNIVLLFALLFAVFGQTIGGGLVDAYTIKKIMPRLLVAVILLNLSIYIVALIIDVGNILGRGIGQIITAPLGDESVFNFQLGGLSESLLGVGVIGGLVGGIPTLLAGLAGAIGVIGVGGLGSLLTGALFILLPALLVIIAVFITLILRQAIILLLAIISPIALALWAVPGGDKYTKMWFENFLKAVMMYPIIAAIFAVADVLAYTLFNTGIGSTSATRNVVADLAGIIVLIAPMAMIPFAFKFAGNILGSINGFVMGNRGKVDKLVRGDKHDHNSRYFKRKSGGGLMIGGLNEKSRQVFDDAKTRQLGKGWRGILTGNKTTAGTQKVPTRFGSTYSRSGTPPIDTPDGGPDASGPTGSGPGGPGGGGSGGGSSGSGKRTTTIPIDPGKPGGGSGGGGPLPPPTGLPIPVDPGRPGEPGGSSSGSGGGGPLPPPTGLPIPIDPGRPGSGSGSTASPWAPPSTIDPSSSGKTPETSSPDSKDDAPTNRRAEDLIKRNLEAAEKAREDAQSSKDKAESARNAAQAAESGARGAAADTSASTKRNQRSDSEKPRDTFEPPAPGTAYNPKPIPPYEPPQAKDRIDKKPPETP